MMDWLRTTLACVIPDSYTESETDTKSDDGLVWKKRKVSGSLGERQGEHVFAIKIMWHI